MSGLVTLSAGDRARLASLKRALPADYGGNRFCAPLSPPRRTPPPEEPLPCLQKITETAQETAAGHVTLKLRRGILASHAPDGGDELLFFTHQLRALQLVERSDVEAFLLSYGTGAGKTVIAAAIVACCYRKRQLEGTQAQMKIAISVPPVLRGQWRRVLQRWLRLDPSSILEVKRGDDLTFAAIEKATIVLLTRRLLSNDFEAAFEKTAAGTWRRKEGTDLPPIFSYDFDRLIIDEVHSLKNPKIPLCEAHAELAKRCAKRVGMSATLVQSSMADLAGESKALGMPARFCDESAWNDGERGGVNFDTLRAFRKYQDVFSSSLLGLPEPNYETVYISLTLSRDAITKYNRVLKQGRAIKISKDEADTDAERKLSQLSTAVRILQHVPVSPQLPLYMAKQLHESPELVQRMADDDGGALAAMLGLLRQIRERPDGGRVIVTAAYTTHLKVLHAYLTKHAPEEQVLYFDADTADRGGMVDDFLADSNPRCVLLLSIGAGGVGLDLVVDPEKQRSGVNRGCSHIVFFGARQYTAALEAQAVGRIHRIGQTLPVHVFHLLVKGGVDEAIGRLQAEKDNLASAVDGDFSHFSSSSGSHRWKQSGGVLKHCLLLNDAGQPVVPTETEAKVRRAHDALTQKQPKHARTRVVPYE